MQRWFSNTNSRVRYLIEKLNERLCNKYFETTVYSIIFRTAVHSNDCNLNICFRAIVRKPPRINKGIENL